MDAAMVEANLAEVKSRAHARQARRLTNDEAGYLDVQEAQWEETAWHTVSMLMSRAKVVAARETDALMLAAQRKATGTVRSARNEAQDIVMAARKRATEIISAAVDRAEDIVRCAEASQNEVLAARRIIEYAHEEAEVIERNARAEADRLILDTRREFDDSLSASPPLSSADFPTQFIPVVDGPFRSRKGRLLETGGRQAGLGSRFDRDGLSRHWHEIVEQVYQALNDRRLALELAEQVCARAQTELSGLYGNADEMLPWLRNLTQQVIKEYRSGVMRSSRPRPRR